MVAIGFTPYAMRLATGNAKRGEVAACAGVEKQVPEKLGEESRRCIYPPSSTTDHEQTEMFKMVRWTLVSTQSSEEGTR